MENKTVVLLSFMWASATILVAADAFEYGEASGGKRLFFIMNTNVESKNSAQSWSDWAKHKIFVGSKSLEYNNRKEEESKGAINMAKEAATKSTKTMNNVASGTATYASRKAEAATYMARVKAGRMKEKASYVATNIKTTISQVRTNNPIQHSLRSATAKM